MHYNVRWNTHSRNLLAHFQRLRADGELTDVTLSSAEGRHFPCHRMVLAAASPYFGGIFRGNSSRELVIVLVGVKAWEVTALLDYMYDGEVRIRDQAQLEKLLGTAEVLKIKGLEGARSRVGGDDDGSEIGRGEENNVGEGVMEDWDGMMGSIFQGHTVPRGHTVDALSAFGAAVTSCSSGQFGTSFLPNNVGTSVDGDGMRRRVRVPQPPQCNRSERMEQETDEGAEEEDPEHYQSPPIQQNHWKSMQPPQSDGKASGNENLFQDGDGNGNDEVATNYVSEGSSGEPSNASRAGCSSGRGTKKIENKSPNKTRRSSMKYQRKIGGGGGNGQSGGGGGSGRSGSSSGTPRRASCFPTLTTEERAARCRQAAELVLHDDVSAREAAKRLEVPRTTVMAYMKRHRIRKCDLIGTAGAIQKRSIR